jgi:uncharacterized protein
MISRRTFFTRIGQLALSGIAAGSYAFIIEPGFRLRIQSYTFTPPRWTPGLKLRVVLLSDPHLIEPHMPTSRWRMIVETANALQPDVGLFLGDYVAGHFFRTGTVPVAEAAKGAAQLKARLGTFAIQGNHDWWDDKTAQKRGFGPTLAHRAFEDAGIPVLNNQVRRIENNGLPFWISGTDSMIAIIKGRDNFESRADIAGTMAQINDSAPVIHMAHEPDLFVDLSESISLTVSGHTHGGQVRLFGWSPIVPSWYGNRFAYGHINEAGRHLVVSGGLGCSIAPVRFGMPPEITVLELG